MSPALPRVVVFGSANVDTFHRVPALPAAGETVLGTGLLVAVGGKGANQAIAAARAGADVAFLGATGRDAEGARIRATLDAAGVATEHVLDLDAPTGRAVILVDDAGENVIVVALGANSELTPGHVAALSPAIAGASVLVVQGEAPAAATAAAVRAAAQAGVRVVVNLAPVVDLGGAERDADPLVLNEVEAAQLLGVLVTGPESRDAVAALAGHARSAVVTLGAQGALVVADGTVRHVPAPAPSHVVDTTGAGDAFVGVLAAALAAGRDLDAAVGDAVRAATASVEVLGAGESYPAFTLGD